MQRDIRVLIEQGGCGSPTTPAGLPGTATLATPACTSHGLQSGAFRSDVSTGSTGIHV